ncbi:hypothetical protein [endosymbiont of unidentified scaly snail isolate Monju]|uniref:hypothetical protein n=1 Tax=endosymbiont of unidentified scaly snail isolate Monju TaxID=1248727 RepID=UPI0005BC278E|nr:hypothetical protein [endosymbiont of unidentified scaly snail isolate Monju]
MKTLIIAGLIGLSSSVLALDNDLYIEGHFPIITDVVTMGTPMPIGDPANEELYLEGHFPIIDKIRDREAIVDSINPDDLYLEGNYSFFPV